MPDGVAFESPQYPPGTVSKILWHFTGGPRWNPATNRQNTAPKEASAAYKNLVAILRSREVRLGSYKELFRVRVPGRRYINMKTGATGKEEATMTEVSSAPVCCLSDIPAPHLGYHAYRYGKFAIGFHRAAVVRHGFNPVLYSLEDARVVRTIHQGFSALTDAEPQLMGSAASRLGEVARDLEHEEPKDNPYDVAGELEEIQSEIQDEGDTIQLAIDDARNSLETFLAFVKTFDASEFATVYCEREWRSVRTFAFTYDDVAMVVLPRAVNRTKYFEKFAKRQAGALKLPRSVPIIPWEDLVEH
jgi:hypothetical protein